MADKLLCYELNEVPWRVVDHFLTRRPDGVLARLLRESDQYTTRTVDGGELHPWTTWPTLHRGVANDVHGIHSLNQDLSGAAAWPPIWDLLNAADISAGICGSLQSYPPSTDPNMLFHVPDTFAAGKQTKPTRYEPFQALNLRQTGDNSAVTSSVGTGEAREALGLFRTGIRPRTMARVARHLVAERVNPLHKRRRPLLQPELALDVFVDCLRHAQPRFATFFTNHVAGIMHRYWKYSFPEDFDYTLSGEGADRFHAESLIAALDQVEEHIARLLPICERHGYEFVICSSMGQEAIERGEYVPELRIARLDALVSALGQRPEDVRMNLAMQPDVALEFSDVATLEAVQAQLEDIRDSSGHALFVTRYAPVGLTLNMNLTRSAAIAADGVVRVGAKELVVDEIGLQVFERDIGTGYHQPEGILAWRRAGGATEQRRLTIDTRAFAPSVLDYFEVPRRDYMQPTISALVAEAAPAVAVA